MQAGYKRERFFKGAGMSLFSAVGSGSALRQYIFRLPALALS